jgi:hypothetical protein
MSNPSHIDSSALHSMVNEYITSLLQKQQEQIYGEVSTKLGMNIEEFKARIGSDYQFNQEFLDKNPKKRGPKGPRKPKPVEDSDGTKKKRGPKPKTQLTPAAPVEQQIFRCNFVDEYAVQCLNMKEPSHSFCELHKSFDQLKTSQEDVICEEIIYNGNTFLLDPLTGKVYEPVEPYTQLGMWNKYSNTIIFN